MKFKTTAYLNGIPLTDKEIKKVFELGKQDELELIHIAM